MKTDELCIERCPICGGIPTFSTSIYEDKETLFFSFKHVCRNECADGVVETRSITGKRFASLSEAVQAWHGSTAKKRNDMQTKIYIFRREKSKDEYLQHLYDTLTQAMESPKRRK